MKKTDKYLSEQILTYMGNKRSLLTEIEDCVKEVQLNLGKDKMVCCDMFSGSGIVARLLKPYSSKIIANDLEKYSYIMNDCFLTNKTDFNEETYNTLLYLLNTLVGEWPVKDGIVRKYYSPANDEDIKKEDRCFYTNKNAQLIDSYRYYIETQVPDEYKNFFLAMLLIQASVHTNTSGVFKGFYKDKNTGIGCFGGTGRNALQRIKGEIVLECPILSNSASTKEIYQLDANKLAKKLKGLDLVYLDPPYNQHPYGSNYFMLNTIIDNKLSDNISTVSGIPSDWNKSSYNKKSEALNSLEDLISNLDTKYIIVSYNNEGFISLKEMEEMLKKYGELKTKQIKYNTFRGSRNLNSRELYTNEYLFVLRKNSN